MHQLLIEHINSLIELKDELLDDGFFSDFQNALQSDRNKELSLPFIIKTLKKNSVFKKKITTSFAHITIKIKGRCDYMALMNGIQIKCDFIDDQAIKKLNSAYLENISLPLRHLLIAHLHKETNQDWFDEISKLMPNFDEASHQLLEAINIPPLIYKGEVLFDKHIKETRRTLAKSWQLIFVEQFFSSSESFGEGWLAIKVILLNHGIKKVFYKFSCDPETVIHWLIEPLAKRDPSADKLLFDLRDTKAVINHDILSEVCDSMLARHSESLEVLRQRYESANNEVPLSQIKKNVLSANQYK